MHVSKPSRTEMYGAMGQSQPAGGRLSDLQSVMYFVSGQGGGALQNAVSSPGLARMAGDRLMMQTADQQGNTSQMADNTRILAPEVATIAFSYFDGTNWVFSWDSATQGGLPKAVEIVLELNTPDGAIPTASENNATAIPASPAATQVYRLIVALPAGKPVISTTQ
jgi:Type II secretion system (T2SS), protein J